MTTTDGEVETIGGGVRVLIVTDEVVGARVWQDDAPTNPTFPYCTIDDALFTNPALSGDGRTLMIARTLQVNLWERIREEDEAVVRRLVAALDGKRVALSGDRRVRLRVTDTQRLVEQANSIVHRALTITARHDPTAL